MRDDRERLADILAAIEKIEPHVAHGREAFDSDEMIQVWIIYHLQIIGEAAARLSDDIRSRASAVPWPDVVSMRKILVHHYFGVDLLEVWRTAERYLPTLKEQVQDLLRSHC